MQKGFALNWIVTNDGRAPLFGARDLEALRDLGAGLVRFELRLGAVSDWNDDLLQRYGAIVRGMIGAGITPLGLITSSIVPGARQADWNANNAETTQGSGDTPFCHQFAATARRLASALPEIALWEVWNEPNGWQRRNGNAFSGGSFIYPSNYAALLAHAGAAIKSVQPNSTIITGGLLGHNNHGILNSQNSGADYLRAACQAVQQPSGASQLFDAVGQHLYVDQPGRADPGHLRQYLGDIESAARGATHGAALPVYITEAAWTTHAVAPDLQAANLRTLFDVCAHDEQVAAVCWFQVRDNPPGNQFYGVCAPDWSPKPAFAAFKAAPTAA